MSWNDLPLFEGLIAALAALLLAIAKLALTVRKTEPPKTLAPAVDHSRELADIKSDVEDAKRGIARVNEAIPDVLAEVRNINTKAEIILALRKRQE